MVMHLEEKNFLCPYCVKTFRTSVTHEDTGKIYPCSICSKVFKSKIILSTHLKTHGDTRPFSCMIIEMSFKVKSGLKTHMRIHEEKRPFECLICQNGFLNDKRNMYN